MVSADKKNTKNLQKKYKKIIEKNLLLLFIKNPLQKKPSLKNK